ncbi:MAG: TatD family hydrolase [Kiritimatiellia bacterium]|nr:TatD family hydrolase [Kiritimatiellia bacterium]
MVLFDTHMHLQDPGLYPRRETVVRRAKEAGVCRMLCCGTHEADWPVVAELAREFPGVVLPAFGLHPMFLGNRSAQWLDRLSSFLDEWPEAAIGETGLDRQLEPRDDAEQETVFRTQCELSFDRKRPLIVHARRVTERMLELLRSAGPHPCGYVLHSFGGPAEVVPAYIQLNAFFSFSGSVTRPESRRVQTALRAVPADRLLLETDAPCIRVFQPDAPASADPASEPADLVHVAEAAARIRGEPITHLAANTETHARQLLTPDWLPQFADY